MDLAFLGCRSCRTGGVRAARHGCGGAGRRRNDAEDARVQLRRYSLRSCYRPAAWHPPSFGFSWRRGCNGGIFLPSIILTVVATPLLLRYGGHPRVAGFVRGVTVAVVGVLAGTTYLIGRPIIVDAFTLALLVGVLVAPFVAKLVPEPAYMALERCSAFSCAIEPSTRAS